MSTVVDATAGAGGLGFRYDEQHHVSLEARGSGDTTRVSALATVAGLRQTWSVDLPGHEVELRIEMSPAAPGFNAEAMGGDRIRLVASPRDGDGEDVLLTELDGRFWTAEVTASFTGRVVGLFATEGTVAFTRFRAEGSDAQPSYDVATPPWHEVADRADRRVVLRLALRRRGGLGRLHLRRRRAATAGLLGRRRPVAPALRGAVRRRLGLGVGGDGRRPRARRS